MCANMNFEVELPIEEYMFWYEALRDNDLTKAKAIIAESEVDEKQKLLNGKFIYTKEIDCNRKDAIHHICSYPLVLAACSGSKDVVTYLVGNGSDLCIIEEFGNNIIHALILCSCKEPEMEAVYIGMYDMIMHIAEAEIRKTLLMMEDKTGLRPLELAAAMTKFYFVGRILQTEDVYAIKCGVTGIYQTIRYDLTDYETTSHNRRKGKSVLDILVKIQREHIDDPGLEYLLSLPIIDLWMKHKQEKMRIPRYVVFLLSSTYLLYIMFATRPFTYIAHLSELTNNRSEIAQSECDKGDNDNELYAFIQMIFMGIPAVGIMIFVLAHTGLIFRKTIQRIYGSKPVGVLGNEFGLAYSPLFECLILTLSITLLSLPFQATTANDRFTISASYVLIIFTDAFSLLLLSQFAPVIGELILVFAHLIPVILKFLLFYMFMYIPLALCATGLTYMFRICDSTFETLPLSAYGTFRTVLNMQDFSELSSYVGSTADFLHILCVIFPGVILTNYLIAIMSDEIIVFRKKSHILKSLNWCRVALNIEPVVIKCLPHKLLRCNNNLVQYENGKYFIESYEMPFKKVPHSF